MALPVPESAAGTREGIRRMLAEHPDGLSDRELAEALVATHPGIDYKAVNHQCRKLVSAGAVERVGTRPVRTRLLPGAGPDGGSPPPSPEWHSTPVDGPPGPPDVPLATDGAAGAPSAPDRPITGAAGTADEPAVTAAPTLSGLPPVQAAVLDALVGAPEGLTDNEIAAALAPSHPDVDPKAFNYQCRKLVKAGLVERSARAKDAPIRTRVTDAGRDEAARDVTREARDGLGAPMGDVSPTADEHADEPAGPVVGNASRRPRPRPKAPSDDLARIRRSERAGDDPDDAPSRLPFPASASASVVLRERLAQRAALRAVPDPPREVVLPQRDVLQGWSRTQNVAAAVATWLTRRGGTVRRATEQGPALDLVAGLDGDDVHVEVTGWPPDGARTHPSTLAADWFRAASAAAVQRRRAHPRSRVVIALPDTRRYRSLTADAATALAAARAEVWFVDAAGQVQLS